MPWQQAGRHAKTGTAARLPLCSVDAACHPRFCSPPALLCRSSRVFKALFNGEVVAAKEIDVGSSPEMRESFITVRWGPQGVR